MADNTKITLSKLELELIKNKDWILTKHSAMEKIASMLWQQVTIITDKFKDVSKEWTELKTVHPKISKGERYLNLPYLILDYPAFFSGQNIFAVRTLFLWGNCISVTLHLSGQYKEKLQTRIFKNINCSSGKLYISVGESQWEHHFDIENFFPVNRMNEALLYEKIMQPSFIKVALQYHLSDVETMEKHLARAYCQMTTILKEN